MASVHRRGDRQGNFTTETPEYWGVSIHKESPGGSPFQELPSRRAERRCKRIWPPERRYDNITHGTLRRGIVHLNVNFLDIFTSAIGLPWAKTPTCTGGGQATFSDNYELQDAQPQQPTSAYPAWQWTATRWSAADRLTALPRADRLLFAVEYGLLHEPNGDPGGELLEDRRGKPGRCSSWSTRYRSEDLSGDIRIRWPSDRVRDRIASTSSN